MLTFITWVVSARFLRCRLTITPLVSTKYFRIMQLSCFYLNFCLLILASIDGSCRQQFLLGCPNKWFSTSLISSTFINGNSSENQNYYYLFCCSSCSSGSSFTSAPDSFNIWRAHHFAAAAAVVVTPPSFPAPQGSPREWLLETKIWTLAVFITNGCHCF